MSVWAKTWAYEQHPKRLDENRKPTDKKHPAAKAILVALAEYPGVGQRVCWPSQATLATMTDYTIRQVRACLRDLEDQGLIKRAERRREDGSRRSDRVELIGPDEAFGPPQDADDQPEESSGGCGREFRGDPEESSGHEPSVRTVNESSRRDADASQEPTNYMSVLSEAAKLLGYSLTTEDRKDLPKNLKAVARESDDDLMREVVRRCLIARSERNYPLSPQRAKREIESGVRPIGSAKQRTEASEEDYIREAY